VYHTRADSGGRTGRLSPEIHPAGLTLDAILIQNE
jgi:hypothetical protein